jgi:predicted amidohydrolase YtcJ
MNRLIFFCILSAYGFLVSCSNREKADLILFNGRIYTVDSLFTIAEAMVIKDGKIIAVGNNDLKEHYDGEKIDLKGAPVYPGFIDAHCHFYGYSTDLVKCDLYGTGSFDEVIERVKNYAAGNQFSWILGRGWDQNDWNVKEFPDNTLLNELFPDIPVFLMRIDGHAVLVNQKALDIAGITASTKIPGGLIEVRNGKLTGILLDNAIDSVKKHIPDFPVDLKTEALLTGEKNCFQAGLTTVADAGLEKDKIFLIDSLQKAGKLKMQVYAMITFDEENKKYFFEHGKIKTDKLNVCSFKLYADGALGSRGACLLHPYSDKPGHYGFMLHDFEQLKSAAEEIYNHDFQLNTHCIGDSANRTLLHLYGLILKEKNNHRWRIEHCQTLHPDDFRLFADYSVIPSVQPTHATSDMYWAESRLGKERIKHAYAYRRLLDSFGMIALGSDFPVESINPLYGFYAAVARTDLQYYPKGGFQIEDALTREEALKGMTIWAAYSLFEENEKGSLEPGKKADFVLLNKDIMQCPIDEVPSVKVLETWIAGEKVFSSSLK